MTKRYEYIPDYRCHAKRHSFSYRNVEAWNNLSNYVVNSESLNHFKSNLEKNFNNQFNIYVQQKSNLRHFQMHMFYVLNSRRMFLQKIIILCEQLINNLNNYRKFGRKNIISNFDANDYSYKSQQKWTKQLTHRE